jgi:hypothetical protein
MSHPVSPVCEICGAAVPEGRRKYCGQKCAATANRRNALARVKALSEANRKARLGARGDQARARVCLVCSKSFASNGPWNRICPSCTELQPPGRLANPVRCSPEGHPIQQPER